MPRRRNVADRAADTAYGIAAWLAFLCVASASLLLLCVTPGLDRRRRVVRAAARLVLWLLGATPEVRGLERLPEGGCVLVANHASYLDGVILTACLPPRFAFVIKKEMSRVPLASFLLRRIGSEFVERNDSHKGALDVRRILQRALTRESLVFFPEGTFRPEPGLRRFLAGAFAMAYRAHAPVVPVTIRGSRAMLPARHWLPRRARLEVIITPPIPNPERQHPPKELLQLARQQILAELHEPDTQS